MTDEIKKRIEQIKCGKVPVKYKKTYAGIIPQDWNADKLSKYIEEYDEIVLDDGTYPVVTSSRNGLMLQSEYYLQQRFVETKGGYHVIPKGYVTYRHMSDDDIFRFNINTIAEKVLVSPEYPVFYTSEKLLLVHLINFLNTSARFRTYCQAQKKGSTRTRLYFNSLRQFIMPVPPIREQEKIAEILTRCDKVIELKKQLIAEELKQKKWLMQRLLDPCSGFRLAGFDGEWGTNSIGEFCDCLDNLRKPVNSSNRLVMKGIYPYYGANNIMDYVSDYLFDEEIVLLAEDGGNYDDYRSKPIAVFVNEKCWVNNHAHILRAKNRQTKYLFYALEHKDIRNYINGSTRGKLTKNDMLSICIDIPPTIEEQTAIANIISTVDYKIELLEQELEQWQLKKKSLMQLLLTGIVRVRL